MPAIIDGSKTFAFAQLEKNSRYDLGDVTTTAKKKGDGWVIDGEKFVVLNGENADTLIVTARTKGGQRDKSGIGVFLVPANAKGVTRKGYPTQDGLHADIAVACVLRLTGEAHPELVDARYPALNAHSERCEALPPFQKIVQPLAPPSGD